MNPATELAEILQSWTGTRNQSVYDSRGVTGQTGTSNVLWDEVAKGLRCLVEIDAILARMEARGDDVSDFRVSRPAWFSAIIEPEYQWQSAANWNGVHIAAPDLANLRMFGRLIDAQGLAPEMSGANIEAIVSTLTEVEDLVNASGLSDISKSRLLWLVGQARSFAEQVDKFGEAVVIHTVQTVVRELWAQSSDDNFGDESMRAKAQNLARGLLLNTVGSLAATGVLGMAPDLIRAISGG